MTALSVTLAEAGGHPAIVLRGELDIASIGPLERAVEEQLASGAATVVVDLRGLTFIDSSGLRVLIAADARSRELDRRLVVVRGEPRVHRAFEVTRLDERLEFVDEL
jgi:anti-anti-sigma factor